MQSIATYRSRGRARIIAAVGVALLAVSTQASAQSGTADLIGTYPLTLGARGNLCPEGSSGTLQIVDIRGGRIRFNWDGTPSDAAFNASTLTFTADHTEPGTTYRAQMVGRFTRAPGHVNLDGTIKWNFSDCIGSFTGSRRVAAQPESATGAEAGTAPAAKAVPRGAIPTARNEEGETETEAKVLDALEKREDPLESLEQLLADGAEAGPLGVLFVLMMITAAAVALRRTRPPRLPSGAGGAGLAGKLAMGVAPPVMPSVRADNFGGFEDKLSYGEQAGSSTPASEKAYEALVIAASAQPPAGSGVPGESGASASEGERPDEREPEEPTKKPSSRPDDPPRGR